MSGRRVVIATTSFAAGDLEAIVGRHPAVIAPGVVRQGTRLYDDDPIVEAHSTLFIDASIIPRHEDERASPPTVPRPQHGPTPMTSFEEVEAKRRELEDAGKPAGERSIAKGLGVSREAVRYALGKDRR